MARDKILQINFLKIFNDRGDSIAYLQNNSKISYNEWIFKINNISKYLKNRSIKPKELIAIKAKRSPETISIIFALWKLGAVAVMLPPQASAYEIERYKIQVPFTQIFDPDQLVTLKVMDQKINLKSDFSVSANDPALIIFTSGSTDSPKGVVLSFGNIYFSSLGSIENYRLTQKDIWPVTLPFFHVSGLMIAFRSFFSGTTFIFSEFNLKETIEKYRPTMLSLVPTQLIRLLDDSDPTANFINIKTIILGGAPTPAWLLKKCHLKKIPIDLTYGLSESCAQLTSHQLVLPYRSLKIDNQNRILIGGKTRFIAYYKMGKLIYPFDNEGYFQTSDLGKWENGKLTIIGRSDLQFISGGENINPLEIEKLLTDIPGINESYLVPVTDKKFGQVGFLFYSGDKILTDKQIISILKEKLPGHKIPKYIEKLPFKKGLKYNRKTLIIEAEKYLK